MAFTFDVMDLMYDVLLIMPHFCVCSIPMSHGRVVLCSLRVSPTLDLVLHSPCIFSSPVCVDLVLGAPWVHFSTFACLWLILDVTADMMDVSRCWNILVCGSFVFEVVAAIMRLLLYFLAGGRYMWWCGSRDHGVYAGNPCAVAFRMFFFAFTWDLVDVSPPVTSLWLLPLLVCWHPAEVVVLVSVILHAIGTRCILHCHSLPGTWSPLLITLFWCCTACFWLLRGLGRSLGAMTVLTINSMGLPLLARNGAGCWTCEMGCIRGRGTNTVPRGVRGRKWPLPLLFFTWQLCIPGTWWMCPVVAYDGDSWSWWSQLRELHGSPCVWCLDDFTD